MNQSQSRLEEHRIAPRTRGENKSCDPQWPIRLWVVDDNESVRDLIADLLGSHEDFLCPNRFSSAEDTIEALECEPAPDVILMDLNMGGMSGVDAISHIRQRAPGTRVVIMTTFYDSSQAVRATRCGASAFMLKGLPVEEIVSGLKAAATLPVPLVAAVEAIPVVTPSSEPVPASFGPRGWNAVRSLFSRKKITSNAAAPSR